MALRIVILASLVHFGFAVRVDTRDDSDGEVSSSWGLSDLSACESNWCRFTALMSRFALQRYRVNRAAGSWPAPPTQDLHKPLLAAKLCQASYEDRATVEQVVAAEGMRLLEYSERYWFASKPNGEVFVVFRGTVDLHDVIVDLFVVPTEHNGAMWHSGFLHFIQRPNLQAALRRNANSPRVTLVGHSLGGANAYALAASGLMPVGHIEEIITFGAPAVIYEESSNLVNTNFKHTAFANQQDPVPRLLGSDPTVVGNILNLYRDVGSDVDTPSPRVLEAVSLYGQQGDAVWLRGDGERSFGRPLVVPEEWRTSVMLLQIIVSLTSAPSNVLANHLMAGYRGGIEEEIRSGGSPAPAPSFWR